MSTLIESRSVRASVCEDVEISVAETRSERRDAFTLVHQAYRRAGLCAECPSGLRWTPYQLLSTTDIIVAKLRGEVISTLSLVRDGELGLPMEEIFAPEVESRRALGIQLAEVSCLADRRRDAERFFGLFCDMNRLMAQLALSLGVDELVAAVHPRHAPLYRRYMGFTQIGDRRDYATVCDNPAVALSSNFSRVATENPKTWDRFFGEPLPHSVLRSSPISAADRHYFSSLCDATCSCRTQRTAVSGGFVHSNATSDLEVCR